MASGGGDEVGSQAGRSIGWLGADNPLWVGSRHNSAVLLRWVRLWLCMAGEPAVARVCWLARTLGPQPVSSTCASQATPWLPVFCLVAGA